MLSFLNVFARALRLKKRKKSQHFSLACASFAKLLHIFSSVSPCSRVRHWAAVVVGWVPRLLRRHVPRAGTPQRLETKRKACAKVLLKPPALPQPSRFGRTPPPFVSLRRRWPTATDAHRRKRQLTLTKSCLKVTCCSATQGEKSETSSSRAVTASKSPEQEPRRFATPRLKAR